MLRPLSIPTFIAVLAVIGAFLSGVRGELPLDVGLALDHTEVTFDRSVVTKLSAVVDSPSTEPTAEPTHPTVSPSLVPSARPSMGRSSAPSRPPTRSPTNNPTDPGDFVGRGELPTDLGLAAKYAIFAGSTVTSTETVGTVVTGDIGIFPGVDLTGSLTGFPPAVLNGAADLVAGDSANAHSALMAAFTTLTQKGFNTTLSGKDLGGMTLIPGVYMFQAAAALNGILTLDARGDAAAVWVFQIGTILTVAEGSSVVFKNSLGNPGYVYWRVRGSATLGAGASMVGNIITALSTITLNDGVTVKGRCLALSAAVILDRSVVTLPAHVSFKATQTIVGLSLEQYNADVVLNSATLMYAIAETMFGIQPSDIKNLEVTAGPTARMVGRIAAPWLPILSY